MSSPGGGGGGGGPAVPEERPDAGPGSPPDPAARPVLDADEIGEPIGPFPTWKALYTTVLVWWAFLVILLWVFTLVFDRGVT
ncbi:MAG TPA: hypothetical protein VLL48_11860 [Longimicrobiales bacterium]|nr:hypothetical protein [Longimicrobiales bacterium]